MYDFNPFKQKTKETEEWLAREYTSIRTGRATPVLLDGVQVTAYGSRVPLKQVANVTTEDARTILVTPFDPSMVKEVEKAIAAGDLGVGTVTGDTSVRVTFPELTTERRQELIKLAKQKMEEARTAVRLARDEAWGDIQEKERAGEVSEDDKFRLKDEMQKIVDQTNAALERLFEQKEKEIDS